MNFLNAQFIKSIGFSENLPEPDGIEIAFSGRSNVGKSSLINRLCNRKALAKVSSTPGKTTTINFFSLGDGVYLTDLPGYGYAKRPDSEKKRWARLMEEYFSGEREIALVVQLLDMRHNPSQDDLVMLDFLMRSNIPFLVTLTKRDKLTKMQQQAHLEDFKTLLKPYRPIDVFPFSTGDPNDAGALRDHITSFVEEAL